jgi:hypothetical protein
MSRVRVAALGAMLVGAGVIRADGVLYRLEADSFYHRDHCVGPCNCKPWSEEGALSGTFVLVFDYSDPLYEYYTVEDIDWHVDGDMGPIDLVGEGTYMFGGEVGVRQAMALTLDDGVWEPGEVQSGLVDGGGGFPEIVITVKSSELLCIQARIDIHAVPAAECYADCDENAVLDLFDFLCFQNAFVGGEGYADCDGGGGLDLFDFLCFQNEFVGGC